MPAETTAAATVFGMSKSFKSKKTGRPNARIISRPGGPYVQKNWDPILIPPTKCRIEDESDFAA